MSDCFLQLKTYDNSQYNPGASFAKRFFWYWISILLFESGLFPTYGLKRIILRAFGARLGKCVIIKAHVRIKYPWRLTVGDYCWLGEDLWIDNLADVLIGDNVCLSQGVYLCTGSHNYRESSFDLMTESIEIASGTWIAARATILQKVKIGRDVVVTAGAVVSDNIADEAIVGGVPAQVIRQR